MLCKKCNTSLDNNDLFCKYCGAKVHGNETTRKIVGMAGLFVLILACGSYIYLSRKGFTFPPKNSPNPSAAINASGNNTTPATPKETAMASALPTVKPAPSAIPSATATFTQKPGETPIAGLDPNIEEIRSMLKESLHGINEYKDAYGSYTPFISKDGYYYDIPSKAYVTAEDLVETNKLAETFRDKKIFFLYVSPADMSEFKEIDFGKSAELELFSAYETNTGVALYSDKNEGIIYRENFNKLLEAYKSEHGKINRLFSANKDYQEIVEAINSYDFHETGYDVRYLAVDELHAFATVSDKKDSSKLMHFITKKDNGKWTVIGSGIETQGKPEVYINNIAPNFNLALLPVFSLSETDLVHPSKFEFLPATLQQQGEVDSAAKVDFLAGTNNFIYIVFSNGKRYFGRYTNDTGWSIAPVTDWGEAEIQLRAGVKNPPTYIIRQE